MAIDIFSPSLGDIALVPIWPNAGAPSNGTSGTLAGIANPGDLLVDTTGKALYQNTNTKASPTWTAAPLTGVAGITSGTIAGVTINTSAIGGVTPAAGSFTTLAASGAVSGAGITALFASPPAVGGTAPAAGAFTTLSASGAVSGAGVTALFASPPAIGGTVAAAGSFTFVRASIGVGLTAVGTNRGNSLALTKQINLVATAASSAVGVTLPASATVGIGGIVRVINDGPSNAFNVYAAGSDTIDLTAGSTGVVLTNAYFCDYQLGSAGAFQSYRQAVTRSA